MSKFSPEQRERILAQSYDILERLVEERAQAEKPRVQADRAEPVENLLPPYEHTNDRHRREIGEQDREWARERQREAATTAQHTVDWQTWMRTEIADQVNAQTQFIMETLLDSLKTSAEIAEAVAALQTKLAQRTGDKNVLPLPARKHVRRSA